MEELDPRFLEYAAVGARTMLVGCMYLVVLLAAGVGFFKAAAIMAVLIGMMVSRLGQPWLQEVGAIAFTIGSPILEWHHRLMVSMRRGGDK